MLKINQRLKFQQVNGYDYLTASEREAIADLKDEISYNGGDSKAPQDNMGVTIKGESTFDFAQENKKDNTEEEKAKEEGKEVIAHDKNTSSVVDKATEEEKEEINNEGGSQLSDSNSLKDALENATKVEAEKVEDNKVENNNSNKVDTPAKETNNKVENNNSNKVETLSVKAVDGYSTYINSSIQFKISGGNDITIEGLEGIDYSFVNGVLTVNTPSEATVIPVCISNSNGNSMTFTITVNGIIG